MMSLEGSYGAVAPAYQTNNTVQLDPTETIDRSIGLSVLYFILSSVIWLLLASLCAAVNGFKLLEPSFLASFEFLSYGRLQGVMKSSLLMGWVSNAIFAIALWLMARLSAKAIGHGGILLVAGFLWNAALTIGIIGIFIGDMSAFSWFELPAYASGIFLLSYALIAVWALVAFRHRKHSFSYVSQWYIIGALLWFPWVYVIAQFFLNYFPTRGVMQSIVHVWSLNNIFYLFVASIGLAAIYYIIPKILNVAIRAYHLSALAFWTFAIFSSWSAFTHLIGGPIPVWLITTSIVSAIALIVPLSIFAINLLGTLKGRFSQGFKIPLMKFVIFGTVAFLLYLLAKCLLSIRSIDAITHFTFIQEGLNWHLLYAFFSMVAFGMFYYLLPILYKRDWASHLGQSIHFVLSSVGVVLLLISMYVGGWIQGSQFNVLEVSFLEIVVSLKLWLQMQCLAYLLILFANSLFFINITSLLLKPVVDCLANPFIKAVERKST